MGWFKKIRAVVDPIGSLVSHYGGKRSNTIKQWDDGLHDTMHFWDFQRVKRGVSKQWGVKVDPLGNQLNKIFFPSSHSASSYYANNEYNVYGPTGSIVGRY